MLTVVALSLRLLRLDFQPLWWDEGYSAWFATHPLGAIAALTAQDIHPPLYYVLLHGWIGLLGAGPVALRLFSVVAGVLAIPAIYLAGRRMFSPRAALFAASLLAINPLHIYYSQEVRMYGLVALLSIGVVAAAWRVFESQPPFPHAPTLPFAASVVYVLLTTAALYTQYYAVFLPIGLTIYLCWHWFGGFSRFRSSTTRPAEASKPGANTVSIADAAPEITLRSKPVLIRWLIAQAAVALLYLPWVLYAAPKLTLYISQKVVQDADRPLGLLEYLARHLAAFLAGHLSGALTPYWPLALLLLAPIFLGLWSGIGGFRIKQPKTTDHHASRITQHSATLLLAAVTLTALALGWLIGLRYPFFPEHGERLLLLALPAFTLLLAAGLDALWPRGERLLPSEIEALAGLPVSTTKPAEASIPRGQLETRAWRLARPVTLAALALIVATSATSLAAFYTTPRYPGDDYRPLIARTVEQGLPEDTVFAVYPWQVGYWRAYGSSTGPTARLTPDTDWTPGVAAALDAALARGKVWFPAHLALGAILETRIEAHLAGSAAPFTNEWYGPGTRLSGWSVTLEPQATDAPAVRFPLRGADGAVELIGVDAARQPIPAANAVVPITLRWHIPAGASTLGVSVRLVDAIGRMWAQHDYEPLGAIACRDVACNVSTTDTLPTSLLRTRCQRLYYGHCQRLYYGRCQRLYYDTANVSTTDIASTDDRLGLLIPAGTPPGQYFVEVALHGKGDAQPLDALAADGRALGAAARLFDLTVTPADRVLGPQRLPIGVRRAQDFADSLRLLGHTLDDRPIAPGAARPVNLFWQATARPASEYMLFVQLLDRAGQVASGWEAPPGGAYATNAWQPGTLIPHPGDDPPPRRSAGRALSADRRAVPRIGQGAPADVWRRRSRGVGHRDGGWPSARPDTAAAAAQG